MQWAPRLLAADKQRGRIWMAGGGSGIVALDQSTGAVEYYALPSAAESPTAHVPVGCEDYGGCPPPRPTFTSVDGIAVAPNGDLYFSDGTYNRIGIVHPR